MSQQRTLNQIAILTAALTPDDFNFFRAERNDDRPYNQEIDGYFNRCEEVPTNWNFFKYDYRAVPKPARGVFANPEYMLDKLESVRVSIENGNIEDFNRFVTELQNAA